MISIFGDKSFCGNKEKLQGKRCNKCGSTNTIETTCYHSYYHIFFIPVFPNSREIIAQCSSCGNIENIDSKEETAKVLLEKSPNPIWTWAGLPLYTALLCWIVYTKIKS